MKMFEAVIAAAVVFFAGRACAGEIPPLDRQIPSELRTAVFALG
ncbi:MAG: hypothetical protein AB7U27_02730 [Aminobacteriaceae bacterium]|nr:hypothetical protein [Aminivibrio sp.]MDD3514475.1 hypothetical protein [Synergistaceae bacterium]MEA4953810.1 hypothetical protein [Aminivibrio sp.]